MRTILLCALALFLTGCAQYQYDLVQPPALARHIGPTPTVVPDGPLVYHFQSYDSHLIVLIENPTNEPIRLDGEFSVIIDPDGQSHPLLSRAIAPHTFIQLILPPVAEATYIWDGPYYAGPGFGYWRYRRFGYWRGGYFYGGPTVVAVYPPDPYYFDWEGETDLRMTLLFEPAAPGAPAFEQSFLFHRQKVR